MKINKYWMKRWAKDNQKLKLIIKKYKNLNKEKP